MSTTTGMLPSGNTAPETVNAFIIPLWNPATAVLTQYLDPTTNSGGYIQSTGTGWAVTTPPAATVNEINTATGTLTVGQNQINYVGNCVVTLPATISVGQQISIISNGGTYTVTPNASQTISSTTLVGLTGATGTLSSTILGICCTITCTTANTALRVSNVYGGQLNLVTA